MNSDITFWCMQPYQYKKENSSIYIYRPCINCKEFKWIRIDSNRKLCRLCSVSGKQNGMYKGMHKKQCVLCGKSFKVYPYRKTESTFCSYKCYWEWMLKEKEPLKEKLEINMNSKTVQNKNSSQYLGIFIAEQILAKIFKNVKMMPPHNHGYDFICANEYKIDAKSSATGYKGSWRFGIGKNKIANYFMCLAFESRDNLTPIHLWLIPGNIVNHQSSLVISKTKTNLAKWSKYEQPINKVILCCDKMKQNGGYI